MERIRINDASIEGLRGGRGEVHPCRIGERLAVSRCHFLHLCFRGDMLKKAFAQNVVKLVAVRIDRGDRNGDSPRFRSDALDGAVECRFERGLTSTVICSGQIGEDKAHVIHLRDGDEQIRKSGRRHDPEIPVADGNCYRVRQIRRKFIQKEDERISTEQLLPRFGSRRTEQWRDILRELFAFAELLRDCAPDATRSIGASAVETSHSAWAELRSGVLIAENLLPQLWITRE